MDGCGCVVGEAAVEDEGVGSWGFDLAGRVRGVDVGPHARGAFGERRASRRWVSLPRGSTVSHVRPLARALRSRSTVRVGASVGVSDKTPAYGHFRNTPHAE